MRLAAAALVACAALAALEPAHPQPAGPAFWVLSTGLRALAQEVPANGLVAVSVVVGAGPRVEEPGQAGISVLVREVMLRGTVRRSGNQVADALDSLGASLRALTGPDHTEWTLLVPAENLDPALELMAELLIQPRFAPEEVEAQRRVSLVRLRQQQDQPQSRAVELVASHLYRWHPYGNPLLGTPESLGRIGRDDLVRYHRTFYTAPNVVISVAGEVPAPVAVAKVQRVFRSLPATPLPARVRLLDVHERALAERPSSRRDVREAKDTASTWIAVGYLAVGVGHPDWPALRVAAGLLGGGMASRLFQSVRERAGLAYAVGASLPASKGPAALTLTAGVHPANVDRALAAMLREVDHVRSRGPEEEEVALARSRVVGLHLLDHEDLRRRAFYPAWYELLGVGHRFDRRVVELASRVTPADVQRVARRYLEHPVVAVVGPAR
ncbi:MAG: pitrilysin family protein [Armatimonadota bacterium]|nr:insulinase family protein [Armatimonadota bacterium]MDW8155924.1 pitrilysin family protein [Armatimonadota bacterium]